MDEAQFITQAVVTWSYVGVYGISALANVFIPVPEEIIFLALGYITGMGTISFWVAVPIAIAGAVSSDIMMFALSRGNNRFVRAFYERFFAKIFPMTPEFLDRHIVKIVVISRFLVQLRFLGPFLGGQSRMSYKKFIIWDTLALGVYITALMAAGRYFQNRIEGIFSGVEEFRNILLIALGLVLVWSIGQYLKKFFLENFVISFDDQGNIHEKTLIPGVWRIIKKKPGDDIRLK